MEKATATVGAVAGGLGRDSHDWRIERSGIVALRGFAPARHGTLLHNFTCYAA
ncbi:MAG: hypothetical protein ABFD92_17615 [Planctomycetaceae bacterium]|nr:hypothetical protein [Planctomycetaceae bacterium]